MSARKVHYRLENGFLACGSVGICFAWSSCMITSKRTPEGVTCARCLAYINRQEKADDRLQDR